MECRIEDKKDIDQEKENNEGSEPSLQLELAIHSMEGQTAKERCWSEFMCRMNTGLCDVTIKSTPIIIFSEQIRYRVIQLDL